MANRTTRTHRTLSIVLACYAAAAVLAGGIYEIISRIQYARWRSHFDNHGWLGTVTVPSSDPVLLWEYRPYGHYRGEMGDIAVNRYGFRDRDFETPEKPRGVWRIAFVGDSVTLGMLSPPESIFVRRFEAEANERGAFGVVQALNFGVDGYDARQIDELLRTKVAMFDPDAVVYVMCLNDFDFEWSSADKRRYFEKPATFVLPALEAAFIRLFNVNSVEYSFRKHREAVAECVRDMQGFAHEHGWDFLVAVLPAFVGEDFRTYRYATLHDRIGRSLSDESIPHVDLLATFQKSGARPVDVAHDFWHPNALGNGMIAHALVSVVFGHMHAPSGESPLPAPAPRRTGASPPARPRGITADPPGSATSRSAS